MSITIKGQTPYRLSPLDFTPPLVNDSTQPGAEYDAATVLTRLVKNKFLQPLTPTSTVTITKDDGSAVSAEKLGELIARPLIVDDYGNTLDDTPENNAIALDIMAQATVAIATGKYPYVRQVFLSQALGELHMPPPSLGMKTHGRHVIYTVADTVIPAARELLAAIGAPSNPSAFNDGVVCWSQLFVGLCATFRPETLGIAMLNEDTWKQFTSRLVAKATQLQIAGTADAGLVEKAKQLAKVDFTDLTEPLRLRKDTSQPTNDYSFARVVVSEAFKFVADEAATAKDNNRAQHADVFAFDLNELICPETIIFINAEAHARNSEDAIEREWRSLIKDLLNGPKLMSFRSITRLKPLHNTITRMDKIAANGGVKDAENLQRAAGENDFSDTPLPPTAIAMEISERLKKMHQVNRSQNVHRQNRKTWSRMSRRRPGLAPGKGKQISFWPDLHLYSDTSGSMSLGDYQDSALFLMQLAQKFNMDFYFSSHSHILSPELLLPVKGKSTPAMANLLDVVPKVTGHNDFTMFYNYIQESSERRSRMNVVTTDFGWKANARNRFTHPDNIIYVPAFDRTGSPQDVARRWKYVRELCADFINSMRPYDPNIDSKILGMGYQGPSITT